MPQIVTYSPAYTIVPTYECFNRCSYCNFRADPNQSPWLKRSQAEEIFKKLDSEQVCEILILSGEVHPTSPRRKDWLARIYELCELALSMGFLPHSNVGPLSLTEMRKLQEVNVSMGLMLEQITPKLLNTVHKLAPSKVPELRLEQLAWAGELNIPFTTGLLLGIGESQADRKETLEAIAEHQIRWGNIQEVILQPHSLGTKQSDRTESFPIDRLPEVVAIARSILPASIAIQIPPNLVLHPHLLLECLQAGARDLGGISPRDEVNPDYPHLNAQMLAEILEPAGWQLTPRLPVYPQYYQQVSPRLQRAIAQFNFHRAF